MTEPCSLGRLREEPSSAFLGASDFPWLVSAEVLKLSSLQGFLILCVWLLLVSCEDTCDRI